MKSTNEYDRIKRLFREALTLDPGERRAFLEKECGGDSRVVDEVLELLEYDEDSDGPIPPAAPGEVPANTTELMRRLEARRPSEAHHDTLGQVAQGGMGTIWRVWDPLLRRSIAKKTVRNPGSGAPLDRFLEEAQVTGQLDHPGIVPVHELGVDPDGVPFFTMPLVHGRELREILSEYHASRGAKKGGEAWTLPRLVGVVLRVCETMAYAHDKGVVHRDLKPANVMVGRYGEVYVMDWGLARLLARGDSRDLRVRKDRAERVQTDRFDQAESTPDSPLFTMDGDVIGTPCYMPPEQALGRITEIGPGADVYSAGAILYHVLAGDAPYASADKKNNVAVLEAVRSGPPRSLSDAGSKVSPELVAICEKAMARDVNARYASMNAFARDLRAYLEDRTVGAYATGPWAEFRKWVRRNRGVAYTAAAGVALVTGTFAIGTAVLSRKNVALQAATTSAQLSEARAERRFEEVRDLAGSFVFELDVQLESLPGSTKAREFLVLKGLRYLDGLAKESAGDANLLFDVARGYLRIAKIQGSFRRPSLGDGEGALKSYEKADRILAELRRLSPEDADLVELVADVKFGFADAAFQRGDMALVSKELVEVSEVHAELARVGGGPNFDGVACLAQRLGDVHRHHGELESALAQYEKGREFAYGWLNEARENVGALELCSIMESKVAKTLLLTGDTEGALERFKESEKLARKVLELDPNQVWARGAVSVAAIDRGDIERDRGKLDEALARYREALAIREVLWDLDQANTWFQDRLAIALERVGDVLARKRLWSEAEPYQERSLGLRRQRALAAPADVAAQRELAVSHEKLGNVRADLGQFESGLEHQREALRIREELFEASPDNAEASRDLAVTHFKLGLVFESAASGRIRPETEVDPAELWESAYAHFAQALERQEAAVASGLAYPSDAHVPALISEHLRVCETALEGE